ncbi:hypothetical protein D030_1601A, partial [Vibrio parahaemolyticus AQ3810]
MNTEKGKDNEQCHEPKGLIENEQQCQRC